MAQVGKYKLVTRPPRKPRASASGNNANQSSEPVADPRLSKSEHANLVTTILTNDKAASEIDRFLSKPENAKLFQQERLILTMTCLLQEELDKRKITHAELARRMGVNRSRIHQIMEGANVSLRSLSDLFFAIGMRVNLTITEGVGVSTEQVAEAVASKVDVKLLKQAGIPL